MVRTKIIATLGPASSTETVLRKMVIKGLDFVRLNFSHGTEKEHLHRVRLIRTINKKMRRAVKIMQDLEGYRIRIGRVEQPVVLNKGHKFYLTQEDILGNSEIVPFDYVGSLKKIKPGIKIYVDDGKLVFEVKAVEKRCLKVKSLASGTLKDYKGVNIPDVKLDFEALTEKDKKDLKLAVKYKFDCVAQSFVRSAKDVELIEGLVRPLHPDCRIFAKVESRQALENIDGIIKQADGIVVARGDLGICVPIYKIPVIQKEIVKKCRQNNKPVVVATQMLESMTEERLPTRAEVNDVANAVFDGATHLMLSAETAVGKYPDRAVDMMNKIMISAERYLEKKN